MQLRQSARLLAAAGALLLTAPVLSSCGFNYATDRVYTPAAGTNARDANVDVLNAVIVSAQPGSGTLVASFANNNQESPATVESVEGTVEAVDASGQSSPVTAQSFTPIQIDPGQLVSPVGETGESSSIVLTGDFKAGYVVKLKFGFGNGQSAQLDVPVVPPCHEYEGLDKSGSSTSSSSSSSSASGSASPSSTPSSSSSSSSSTGSSTSTSTSTEDLCSVESASGEPSIGVS